jgi:hypothetical protein
MDMSNLDIVAAILTAPYLGPAGRNDPGAAVLLFHEIRDELIKQEWKEPEIIDFRGR